jgi:SulP family sulfate permease
MPDSLVPKTVSILAEGYGAARLKADAFAGLTVAIVALPLSMAIAIASGVTPDRGLYTAIVGGFLVSLLGGSRVQIGGPPVPSSCSSPPRLRGTASTACCSRPSCPGSC